MTEMTVPDMTCQHCKASIEKAIAGVDPQAQVTVDLAGHLVTITSGSGDEALLQAVRDAGFEPALRG